MTTPADPCTQFRPFTAALVDGERALVPWRARWHIRRCRGCQAELALQATVAGRLREALQVAAPARVRSRRRLLAGVTAGGLAAAGGAVAAALLLTAQPDLVPSAVTAAAQPPSTHAADVASIARWCRSQAGGVPPVLSLAALPIEGARMDLIDGRNTITIYYADSGAVPLTVTWVAMSRAQPGAVHVAMRPVGGHSALVVSNSAMTAVVAGDGQAAELWRAAAVLAAAM